MRAYTALAAGLTVDDHSDENLFYKHFPRGLGKPEGI